MSEDLGTGVSRTLTAKDNQFQVVVWQANKPPLDSELNLISQIEWDKRAQLVRSTSHSGWLLDPMASDTDFVTDSTWSNWFKLGRTEDKILHANVNGWILPISGSNLNDLSNRINLLPPPETDSRIDFVFLEVWSTLVAPNPSTVNKPNAQSIWKYGNVQYGGTNVSDDLEDPSIGFETTKRVQLQYRLRVVSSSVDLNQYPDGMNDPNVLAQGTTSSPLAGFSFTNMKEELGDTGLWRSGDGDPNNSLGTIDGYVYAIPVCAVFRRNSSPFVARINSGNANQNGGLNRNPKNTPIIDPVDGTGVVLEISLGTDLNPGDYGVVPVTGLASSGFDNSDIDWSSTFLQIEDEIIGIDSVDVGAGTITISDPAIRQGRGRWGTQDSKHWIGTPITFFNFRPDGKFSDEITHTDILDLRKGVTLGEWDYNTLLKHNLDKLLKGTLRSVHKQGNGTDTQGVQFLEVDTLLGLGGGTLPNQTEQLDGFDGVRTHFSDSVVVQKGISTLLSPVSTGSSDPTVVTDFTIGAGSWEVAPDFAISGFQPTADSGWVQGTVIKLWLGGTSGNSGVRGTTQNTSNNRFTRFLSPKEYWLDDVSGIKAYTNPTLVSPVDLQFEWSLPNYDYDSPSTEQRNVGPICTLKENNFESPFLFLGGVVNNNLLSTSAILHKGTSPDGYDELEIPGVDFDVAGGWYNTSNTDEQALSTNGILNLVVHKTKNILSLLTQDTTDLSGLKSELYAVLTNDLVNSGNCGAFKVIGLGTVVDTYTELVASNSNRLVILPVNTGGVTVDGATVRVECRSFYTNTEDGPTSSSTSASSAVIVLGDLSTRSDYPGGNNTSRMVLNTSVVYGPSRGSTARVADHINRLAVLNPPSNLLRQAPSGIDTQFDNEAGVPDNEVYYKTDQSITTWSQAQSLGMYPPFVDTVEDGSGRFGINAYRDGESFLDKGSKTLVFRPFQKLTMSMFLSSVEASRVSIPQFYDDGVTPIDSANIKAPSFTVGPDTFERVYPVPLNYMPKFGRQDVPVRKFTGTGGILGGINYWFADEIGNTPTTSDVFNIIGGRNASTPTDGGVFPMYLTTESATTRPYGGYGLITGSVNAYQGRMYEDLQGRSSDVNKKLYGIQLPPFMGIARVYGIYDVRDWNNTNGAGAFQQDRNTLKTTGTRSTNLLKTNADTQTLWILKDGASDVLSGGDAHTFMIPEEAINIELSPEYVPGEEFNDVEFVVEMTVFTFARGFINRNNFVCSRAYNGAGLPAGDVSTEQLTSLSMLIPAPMRGNTQGYITYSRTPYQGDPYMTRDGETLQPADYEHRYGTVPVSSAFELSKPIQQYDSVNLQVPEAVNCRSLEVVTSVDFWTTLGTGKIGGFVKPNTIDAGYLQSGSKVPMSATGNPKQPMLRAFTEGQQSNKHYGQVQIVVTNNSVLPVTFTVKVQGNYLQTVTVTTQGTAEATITNIQTQFSSFANDLGVSMFAMGNVLTITNLQAGHKHHKVFIGGTTQGITVLNPLPSNTGIITTQDEPTNGITSLQASTPLSLTGCTERLPLGILVQDSDFIGEDPTRQGMTLVIKETSGLGTELNLPLTDKGESYSRVNTSGFIGMGDGSVLRYTPYQQGVTDTGTKRFRLYRGGGSIYSIENVPGGPIDFGLEGFSDTQQPVLKGNVLLGRAYLVRNYKEQAFTGNVTRTYGDELQMLITTYTVTGEGVLCESGYQLQGLISPTGYGEGMAASDRYRLEGKPMYQKGSSKAPECDIEFAPYPGKDITDDPCA